MAFNECRVLRWNVSEFIFICILHSNVPVHSFRHVTKTGEIKDFVITEESGIAKGIRRIIGVTGNEAKEVRRLGDALKTKLDNAEKLEGKEKDAALRGLTVVRSFL